MDHNSRKAGIGSTIVSNKESPRSMLSDPSKSGRLAATALGRPGKEYVQSSGDHTSHDHVKSRTSKEPQRSSKDCVKLKDNTSQKPVTTSSPQLKPRVNMIADRNENVGRPPATSEKLLHRLKDDREREILNQSLKRTKVTSGEQVPKMLKDDREREILNQSLKRTKVASGEEVPKMLQRDSRDTLNRSLKRPDQEGFKVVRRPKGERDPLNRSLKRTLEVSGADHSKVRLEHPREPLKCKGTARPPDQGRDVPKEPVRSVKMVTGTVVKAKEEKVKKKVFSLPGQRFEPPEERDALRLFYGSLHRQIPASDMANIWLMEHGLLEADEAQKVLTHKVKSKPGLASKATPTPSKFSNGSAGKSAKFRNEDFLDIKPVSKKSKL